MPVVKRTIVPPLSGALSLSCIALRRALASGLQQEKCFGNMKVKPDRARHHIESVSSFIKSYLDTSPFRIVIFHQLRRRRGLSCGQIGSTRDDIIQRLDWLVVFRASHCLKHTDIAFVERVRWLGLGGNDPIPSSRLTPAPRLVGSELH